MKNSQKIIKWRGYDDSYSPLSSPCALIERSEFMLIDDNNHEYIEIDDENYDNLEGQNLINIEL